MPIRDVLSSDDFLRLDRTSEVDLAGYSRVEIFHGTYAPYSPTGLIVKDGSTYLYKLNSREVEVRNEYLKELAKKYTGLFPDQIMIDGEMQPTDIDALVEKVNKGRGQIIIFWPTQMVSEAQIPQVIILLSKKECEIARATNQMANTLLHHIENLHLRHGYDGVLDSEHYTAFDLEAPKDRGNSFSINKDTVQSFVDVQQEVRRAALQLLAFERRKIEAFYILRILELPADRPIKSIQWMSDFAERLLELSTVYGAIEIINDALKTVMGKSVNNLKVFFDGKMYEPVDINIVLSFATESLSEDQIGAIEGIGKNVYFRAVHQKIASTDAVQEGLLLLVIKEYRENREQFSLERLREIIEEYISQIDNQSRSLVSMVNSPGTNSVGMDNATNVETLRILNELRPDLFPVVKGITELGATGNSLDGEDPPALTDRPYDPWRTR